MYDAHASPVARLPRSPHRLEELFTGDELAAVREEHLRASAARSVSAARVRRYQVTCRATRSTTTSPARTTAAARRIRRRPAEVRTRTGEELLGFERLQHVVVGTRLQRRDLVAQAVAHGEHDDGYVGERPEVPQGLEPVDAGQGEVEDHEVGWRVDAMLNASSPLSAFGDVEVPVPEVARRRSPQRPVVLDQQDRAHGVLLSLPAGSSTTKVAPPPVSRSHHTPTVLRVDQRSHDREPRARAAAVGRRVATDEFAEDHLPFGHGHAGTVVDDRELDRRAVSEPRISTGAQRRRAPLRSP